MASMTYADLDIAFAYRMFHAVGAAVRARTGPGRPTLVHVPPEVAKVWLTERGLADNFCYAATPNDLSAPSIVYAELGLTVVPEASMKGSLAFRLFE